LKKPALLFILGTRPEAIKMAPLIRQFREHGQFKVSVCLTAQHREMLDQVLRFFSIEADYDLDIMKPGQSLVDITSLALKGIEKVLDEEKPDMVFVQGDTTTAFIGALAAYYKKIKVSHIEAGLRSENKYSPFPEEMNRVMTGHLADYHFAPTEMAVENLRKENITANVYNTGNTVIDALLLGLEILKSKDSDINASLSFVQSGKKIVLITGHRRESFGEPFINICESIHELAAKYKSVDFIYPVHLNPNVQEPVKRILKGLSNVHLIEPLDYPDFIWLMNKSYIVLTDSGGLQEEAPSLGKPVLVMREVTERQEGITAGTARLVGTDKNEIIKMVTRLLEDEKFHESMAKAVNPYGDGKATPRIIEVVSRLYLKQPASSAKQI
jgi:UDP-N-acetylglucosamine 2-epimerase (non-hydrolysing)